MKCVSYTRTLPWKNHQGELTIAEQNQRIAACRKHPQPLPEHLSAGRGGETEQDGRNAVWKEVGYGIAI